LENRTKRRLFKDEFPDMLEQLHQTKNVHINWDKITTGSMKKAVWVCTACQDEPQG
jgi:hypothetical protein